MPDDLRINSRLTIPGAELVERATASSGPGGQHANTSNTRVVVSFDVVASAVLSDSQRRRLSERFGTTVAATSQAGRSQARNREAAREQLAERIAGALVVAKPRRATKATRGSQKRRLAAKARRSETKAQRRRPGRGDW